MNGAELAQKTEGSVFFANPLVEFSWNSVEKLP
jgi:hypothetical protein